MSAQTSAKATACTCGGSWPCYRTWPWHRPVTGAVPDRRQDNWARRIVASIPRPTPAEEDAAALDYAETALSEAWQALMEVRDWDSAAAARHGGIGVREFAAQFLEAHAFVTPAASPTGPDRTVAAALGEA